ncbi:MAG TPA: hypothetical protein VLZ33_07795 [Dysgonamonadaceae bacterium]|nr:hypothetical protein [Dysgonamonadaceae bacterium]
MIKFIIITEFEEAQPIQDSMERHNLSFNYAQLNKFNFKKHNITLIL